MHICLAFFAMVGAMVFGYWSSSEAPPREPETLGSVVSIGVYSTPEDAIRAAEAPKGEQVVLKLELDVRRLKPADRTPERLNALADVAIEGLYARFGDDAKIYNAVGDEALPPKIVIRMPPVLGFTQARAENLALRAGVLEMLPIAAEGDFERLGTTRAAERLKLDAWMAHDGMTQTFAAFHELGSSKGGPTEGVRWAWSGPLDKKGGQEPVALAVPQDESARIDSAWIGRVYESVDEFGRAALGFDVNKGHHEAFETATAAHIDRSLAIIIGEEIVMSPMINAPLRGGGVISGGAGGFEMHEVADLLHILETPMESTPLCFASGK